VLVLSNVTPGTGQPLELKRAVELRIVNEVPLVLELLSLLRERRMTAVADQRSIRILLDKCQRLAIDAWAHATGVHAGFPILVLVSVADTAALWA
jgi:hypothetical protein